MATATLLDNTFLTTLRGVIPLDIFVHAGSVDEGLITTLKSSFNRIYAIGSDPGAYQQITSPSDLISINLLAGNTSTALTGLMPEIGHRSVLFYLKGEAPADRASPAKARPKHQNRRKHARMSVPEKYPAIPAFPVISELRSIACLNDNSMIVIGNAQLLLAVPESADRQKQNSVLDVLYTLSASHAWLVIRDYLFFFPQRMTSLLRQYTDMSGDGSLTNALAGTSPAHPSGSRQEHSNQEIDALQTLLSDTRQALLHLGRQVELLCETHDADNRLPRIVDESQPITGPEDPALEALRLAHALELGNLQAIADARLQIIEDQEKALKALRRWRLKDRLKRFLSPRLGVLYHYSPRPLHIPARYTRIKRLESPPLISIVTPSYNQAEFLERTIQSVLTQDYAQLEYIIQDGASTDHSPEIMNKYAGSLKHAESAKDTGQTQAINLGFKHASGEILAYLNSDDMLLPGTLHYVASFFEKHPGIDVVYGHRVLIDEYDRDIGRWVLPPHDNDILSWADYIPQETLFWRRRAWEKIGESLDEGFRFAMDWDLILRLRDSGARFARLPRFLGAFRTHPHQKTSAELMELGQQEMYRLRERCHGRSVSYLDINKNTQSYFRRHVIFNKLYEWKLVSY